MPAIIPIAAAVGSAAISANASSKAAKTQAAAATDAANAQLIASREANDLQKLIYDQSRADNEPWRVAGSNALSSLVNYRQPTLPSVDSGSFGNTTLSDASSPDVAAWYRTALKREPDAAGAAFWQSEISKGRNADDVYSSFLQSAKKNNENIDPNYSSWQQTAKSNYPDAKLADADSAYTGAKLADSDSAYASTDIQDVESAYANPVLKNLLANFSMADFEADPGYQYRLDQGNRGVENSAAARGSQLSGATLKALSRFNQNEAAAEYDKSFNRFRTQKLDQYGQSVDDYGRLENQRLDKYGQRVDRFKMDEGQRQDKYSQRVDDYGRTEGQRLDKYGQRVDDYARTEGQRQDAYGQRTDLYNRNENQRINRYGISQDQYNRGVAEEGRTYSRLADIAGIGQRVNESNAAGGRAYAGQVSANTTNAANAVGNYGVAAGDARASGALGTANAINRGTSNLYGIYKDQGYGDSSYRDDEMYRLRSQASGGY